MRRQTEDRHDSQDEEEEMQTKEEADATFYPGWYKPPSWGSVSPGPAENLPQVHDTSTCSPQTAEIPSPRPGSRLRLKHDLILGPRDLPLDQNSSRFPLSQKPDPGLCGFMYPSLKTRRFLWIRAVICRRQEEKLASQRRNVRRSRAGGSYQGQVSVTQRVVLIWKMCSPEELGDGR